MAIILRAAAGVAALGAALMLVAGCSPAPPPAPVATQTVTVPASSSASPPPTPPSTAGEVRRCVLADLTPTTTPPDGTMNQQRLEVVWTNSSDRTCTMTGFGGVDLVASPRSEDRYSLPRAETPATTVRLAPGERAHSTIVFLPATAGEGVTYTPTQLFVTPPDETHSAVLAWPSGPVLRQDGATRPGTYLEPVAPGAR